MQPMLVKSLDVWDLYCDGLKVVSNMSFVKGFQSWFAAFWVFQIEYPLTAKNSCQFLEKFALQRPISVPGPVSRLANKVIVRQSVTPTSSNASEVPNVVLTSEATARVSARPE